MEKRKKWIKRPAHLALALLLIAILGIGSTIAFFTDIEAAVNSIKFGNIEIETNEEVDGLTKTNIGVTAAGKSECYVRMRVDVPTVEYEYTANGKVEKGMAQVFWSSGGILVSDDVLKWSEVNSMEAIITPARTPQEKVTWELKKDGFWYLSTKLSPGESAELLRAITFSGLWDATNKRMVAPLPDGVTLDMLTIPITSEAVQAEGFGTELDGLDGADAAMKAFKIVNGGSQ